MQFFCNRSKKISCPIRGHFGFHTVPKSMKTSSVPTRRTFLTSLVTSYAVVLSDKKCPYQSEAGAAMDIESL